MSERKEKRKRDAVEGGEAHAASLEEEEEEELGRSIRERTEVRGGGLFTSSPPIWRRDDDMTLVLDKHHKSATNSRFALKSEMKNIKVSQLRSISNHVDSPRLDLVLTVNWISR